MAFSFTFTQQVQTPAGLTSQATTVTASAMLALDESVATGSTDTLINGAFTYAEVKGVYILSDQAITIETNATDHTGGDILTMTANVPKVYFTNFGVNPFAFNVTKFYVTNASGSTANITIRVLYDATP
jgi:hypothetical protein